MKTIKWGILGTAKIACEKVIPAMQKSLYSEVYAIASRSENKAKSAQKKRNIPFAYTSYQALLENKNIQAVYIPLPNHLHKEWTIKALKAGKHVLCEKPMALSSDDVEQIMEISENKSLKVSEAFMLKNHPQWTIAKKLIQQGKIGTLKSISAFFSYYHDDLENIRYKYKHGGGAMWDIGVYPVFTTRFILDEEPEKVLSLMKYETKTKVDTLATAILDFPSAQLTFTVATQMVPYQRMQFFGTKKLLEIQIPFNAPPDKPIKLKLTSGDLFDKNQELIEIPAIDQYTLQADEFSKAILNNTKVIVSLEDSLKNTRVINALFKSALSGSWEKIN